MTGSGGVEEGVQEEERNAPCPGAEVEDGEGLERWLVFGEKGSKVEGVGLCFGPGVG